MLSQQKTLIFRFFICIKKQADTVSLFSSSSIHSKNIE
ncbi:hypothetical protein BSBH6_00859 [Bacillus subtilis]|nr:hypothetical protein BSBH6_00859 [Bacillus subtilis]